MEVSKQLLSRRVTMPELDEERAQPGEDARNTVTEVPKRNVLERFESAVKQNIEGKIEVLANSGMPTEAVLRLILRDLPSLREYAARFKE